jgi:DNA primase
LAVLIKEGSEEARNFFMTTLREFADKIRDTADIVETIGSYLTLKRSGANYKALCPFHQEKTPSFMVSPGKQIFHCFGCNAGGDVIGFVRQYEKVGFKEALELLARKLGLAVPRFSATSYDAELDQYRTVLYEIHALATSFFEAQLKEPKGKKVREYLKGRAISDQIIRDFHIGYAPPGWENFLALAKKKGYSEKALEDAGLIARSARESDEAEGHATAGEREARGYYDRFRDRLIFPIFDTLERCIGFGGRVLDDREPKYINSPETLIYKKGQVLYGLHRAKDALKQTQSALLLEGYTDVITAHQFGFPHAVATLGTALTESQARLLKRYCSEIFFLYDGDEAGQNAMLRGCEVLLKHGFQIWVVTLPRGEDPDSFLRREGKEAFGALLDTKEDFLNFFLSMAAAKADIDSVEGKVRTIDFVRPMLKSVGNPIYLQSYAHRLAEFLGIHEHLINVYLKDVGAGATSSASSAADKLAREIEEKGADTLHSAEKGLLRILVEHTDVREQLKAGPPMSARGEAHGAVGVDFDPDWIFDERVRKWVRVLTSEELASPIDSPQALLASLMERCEDEREAAFLREIVLWDETIEDYPGVIAEIVLRLRLRFEKAKTARLAEEIQQSYANGDQDQILPLLISMHSDSQRIVKQLNQRLGQ